MTAAAPRRIALALLLATLVLGVCFDCRITWEADAAPAVPAVVRDTPTAHVPAPESSAAMVRRQILDARGGTP